MAKYEDIEQKINQELSDRQIAKGVGKRRTTIADFRSGEYKHGDQQKFPDWMNLVNRDLPVILRKKNIIFLDPISYYCAYSDL